MLSDSPGLVEWLVGLAFSHRSLPDGQAQCWFLFSDDKLRFYTKKCVAESSWEKMITLWGQIIIAWQRLAPQFSCFCKGHHDFFAYISDQNIFFEMTIFSNWQQAVWDSLIKFQPSHGAVDFLGNLGAFRWENPNPDSCFYSMFLRLSVHYWNKKGPLHVKLKTKKQLAWRKASRPGAV